MNHPPKLFLRFFRWYAHPKLRGHIEGDLIETYNVQLKTRGKAKANFRFMVDVVLLFRPAIIRPVKRYQHTNGYDMFTNNLTSWFRNLLKQKTYSLINILGLSTGMAITLLITVYVIDEVSYDRFFTDADKIYRVGEHEKYEGSEVRYVESPAPLAEALRRDMPQVTKSVRTAYAKDMIVRVGEKAFLEKRLLIADSTFFDVFNYTLTAGNTVECLRGPNKIVLTASAARKYFGDEPALGKTIGFGEFTFPPAIVTGILPDGPHNTHMKFDMILSMDSWDFAVENTNWTRYDLHTYFKIDDQSSLPVVEKQLEFYMRHNLLPQLEMHLGTSLKAGSNESHFFLQPLTSIHLESRGNGEFEANGDIRYVYIFSGAALFIILIACINFMNLTTARATERAKEVGIRKAVGAGKTSLMKQFMVESFMFVLISGLLAFLIVFLALSPFNLLSGKNLSLDTLTTPEFLSGIVGLMFLVAIIAGSYPAFYLTSFNPVAVLKGKVATGAKQFGLIHGLVVFQFAISLGLIISTLIIYRQLEFIQQQNVGFDRVNLMMIHRTNDLVANRQTFKDELMRYPEFTSSSFVHQAPPNFSETTMISSDRTNKFINTFWATSDKDYVETMGLKMSKGRFYSDTRADSNAAVINQTAARLLGNPEPGDVIDVDNYKCRLIGVMEDFNFESLHGRIAPLVMLREGFYHAMVVRIKPGSHARAVELAQDTWRRFAPGLPLTYSFIDDDFNAQFQAEEKMGKLFQTFTGLAIFIACLGLFGLITLTSAQRAKEIGIRKVLGASVAQITALLSGQLVRLVMLSFIIAVPVTWYGMERWLEGFAYRTNFDFLVVIYAGVAGIVVATLTVSYKSFRTASANPVKALKSE